jgi:hypothetical protein
MRQGKNTGTFLQLVLCLALAPSMACNGGDGNGETDADDATEVVPDVPDTPDGTDPTEDTVTLQPFGGSCGGDDECREGACFEGACTRVCDSFAMCPESGYRCGDAGDGRALCLLTSFETGPGTAGASCAIGGEADCAEGYICLSETVNDPYAFCSRECADDRECPTGMLCKAMVEGDRAYCRPRGYCQRCIIDDECGYAGDKCLTDETGGRFCSRQCVLDGRTCPIDSTCTEMEDSLFQCLPDYEGHRCIGDGELCSPCETDYDCTNGVCMEDYYTHHKFCTVPCSDPSCPDPDQYYCTTDNQCRPRKGSCSSPSGGGLVCDNCEDLTDCRNGYCLAYPDEYHTVCGEDCSDDRTCDSVWAECYEITDGYGSTIGYNCMPRASIANCYQYESCTTNCPDGPTGCALPFCSL